MTREFVFEALFSTQQRKHKTWLDGQLRYSEANHKVSVHDENGAEISSGWASKLPDEGSEIKVENATVQVGSVLRQMATPVKQRPTPKSTPQRVSVQPVKRPDSTPLDAVISRTHKMFKLTRGQSGPNGPNGLYVPNEPSDPQFNPLQSLSPTIVRERSRPVRVDPTPLPVSVPESVCTPVPRPAAEPVRTPVPQTLAEPLPRPVPDPLPRTVPEPLPRTLPVPPPLPVAIPAPAPVSESRNESEITPQSAPLSELRQVPLPKPLALNMPEPVAAVPLNPPERALRPLSRNIPSFTQALRDKSEMPVREPSMTESLPDSLLDFGGSPETVPFSQEIVNDFEFNDILPESLPTVHLPSDPEPEEAPESRLLRPLSAQPALTELSQIRTSFRPVSTIRRPTLIEPDISSDEPEIMGVVRKKKTSVTIPDNCPEEGPWSKEAYMLLTWRPPVLKQEP